MRTAWLLIFSFVVLALLMPINVQAFECPKHFKEAQAAIDKVKGDMGGEMSKMMKKEDMALVHALLDDAKMRLASAKHNHEKPQGRYDHARAIAKADSARGYAVAADIYHWKLMGKMKKMK
ncbi:MAG: hypothetical protein IH856_22030 [Deltaproteobacteria bacterium]|nr:hypothetical protein [Deltaproteobacteria bacterium]